MSKKQKKMLIRIIAAGAIWAIGFAMPLPAISGAEPPEGS